MDFTSSILNVLHIFQCCHFNNLMSHYYTFLFPKHIHSLLGSGPPPPTWITAVTFLMASLPPFLNPQQSILHTGPRMVFIKPKLSDHVFPLKSFKRRHTAHSRRQGCQDLAPASLTILLSPHGPFTAASPSSLGASRNPC